ncbi:MAG: FixH family protein [Polyangiaceae bacterium]
MKVVRGAFRIPAFLRVMLPMLLAASACSSSSASDAADSGAPVALCATDSRAQTFTAGMAEPGASGTYSVKLASINPNPVFKGNNAWTIQVVDKSGAPVSGATITVKPFMPDHGHGSSITPQVAAGADPGTYDVTLLNLFMPGIWTVTVVVTTGTAPSTVSDQSVFTFCVGE